MDLHSRTELLRSSVIEQFIARTDVEGKKKNIDFGIKLTTKVNDGSLWFILSKDEEQHSFNVPIPYEDNGVFLIKQNEVRRAVCPHFIREDDLILSYFAVMQKIICDNPEGIIPEVFIKKAPFIQQIVYSYNNGNTSTIIYNLQRAINEVINKMPLHVTYLNSWVMNRRLLIIDPAFANLKSPEERLAYQIEKNKTYFDRGWTSIGLADGNLADKNYILTCDIRHLTPFGMHYHNPQRNLYSTLGMKGDELPNVRSQSMQDLMDQGITRKGWNLFTLFVDIPDVFEDQIMVDIKHIGKSITYEKRYECYDKLHVHKGKAIRKGQILSTSNAGTIKKFNIDCDKAKVKEIIKATTNVGGTITEVFNVIVEYKRNFRDGVKITNLHGNKGVIRMKDLGYAIDPRTGKTRKIDIIVSAKSIKKRKNFGQLLEALLNNTKEGPTIIPDNYQVDISYVSKILAMNNLPEDGTWSCETYMGRLDGVCGEVFWGVIASVENALWDENATIRKDIKGIRQAGLKLSHVEMRSLETRFGKDNALLTEILSYAQGSDNIHENLKVIKSKRGELPPGVPIYRAEDLSFVDQSTGTIVDEAYIKNTVVDDTFATDGFVMQLPVSYQVTLDDGEVTHEGAANLLLPPSENVYIFDKIYIPKADMRKCWKHDNGKLGLNEIGVLVNNMLVMSHRYIADPENAVAIRMLYNSIYTYFAKISKMLGTKRGDIAQLGMSVRYPFSTKAVATLSNRLPANTIEIHRNMANALRVTNGDVVLVERFPCLGFMSIRPQKIHITDDVLCKYTIRVSGNCLCSLGLDFDGDVIYLASFHTQEAISLLRKEWQLPNELCYEVIKQLNHKAGVPQVGCFGLNCYEIAPFENLTADALGVLVDKATGVKSHTGPVIALSYNIMRILENSEVRDDQEVNIAIEVFLDRVGNTVFKQKHGILSLHSIVMDAICTGDVEMLVEHGFKRETSTTICNIIKKKAADVGIYNLYAYHEKAKDKGWSNVINRIIRKENKIYFASRANLEGCQLLKHLEADPVDIPSRILKLIMSGKSDNAKTVLEDFMDKDAVNTIKDVDKRDACKILMDYVEKILTVTTISDDAHKVMVGGQKELSKSRSAGICFGGNNSFI